VVSSTPRPLYPWERPGTQCTGGWMGPRAGLDVCEISRPYRDSIPGPSSSQSRYRLSYPDPLLHCTVAKLFIKKYYVLFLISVLIVQVTKLVQFTQYNTFSKIPPLTSVHFANRVRTRSVAGLSACWRSFMLVITSIIRSSNSSRVSTYNSQLPLHTDSHASYSGAVRRE
jgi:hypothetical protein